MTTINRYYYVSHDGEGDDLQAVGIVSLSTKDSPIIVDCTIGNKDIVHVSPSDKEQEMAARMQITNELFKREVAIPGAKAKAEVSQSYVEKILADSTKNRCLVLHTGSFTTLHELFSKAKDNQLKDSLFLTYGSVNLTWSLPKSSDEKKSLCEAFYTNIKRSGATLVQVDAHPFLLGRNKLIYSNTPVSAFLLGHLDGTVGEKWLTINRNATEQVRHGEAKKVADYLFASLEKPFSPEQEKLNELLSEVLTVLSTQASYKDSASLTKLLDQSIPIEQHKRVEPLLKQMPSLVCTILGLDKDEAVNVPSPFKIFTATSLKDQGLIADQIPAILFSEIVEGRNGLFKECLPVKFTGFSGNYAQYAVSDEPESLYYLDTKAKCQQNPQCTSEEELINSYLKYIDLCLAAFLLGHAEMISPKTREALLSSPFKDTLLALADEVKALGYDLPHYFVYPHLTQGAYEKTKS